MNYVRSPDRCDVNGRGTTPEKSTLFDSHPYRSSRRSWVGRRECRVRTNPASTEARFFPTCYGSIANSDYVHYFYCDGSSNVHFSFARSAVRRRGIAVTNPPISIRRSPPSQSRVSSSD